MQKGKRLFLAPVGAGILLLIGMILLWPAPSAGAQCGSQASSCKNCHETQAQDPVNNDGTGWHQGHAFGDFCYLCHAGNNQSMDKDQAHAGMVDPLSDVNASCASCHPGDLMDRANVYATALGVTVGSGGGGAASAPGGGSSGSSSSGGSASGGNPPAAQPPAAMVVTGQEAPAESAGVVDYSQQYDEAVLGVRTINWGNLVLWLIILGIAIGGGVFVYWNERRLRGGPRLPAKETRLETRTAAPGIDNYPAEVTGLLPLIAALDPQGLHSLKKILQDPAQANEMLHSLSRLDPELVRRLRALDRDSRALLVALAGD